ncbi:sodium:dicarboxylate symporter [Bacteroidetes bacterium UKL13-3]|jgi:proton glutamate symport protein|nr:sodium:dicarboxylate symporter [Bacteroidetes bacterium UKL13-3]HCP93351.1 dicarboxylate/amino acid:cation symporter [Bacteroidota bacterium]
MDNRKLLFGILALFFIDSTLHILNWMEVASLSTLLLHAVRWVFIGTLGWYTLRSKSLTSSILLAMFLGIEVAEFFPDAAKEMKVFSDIFLRLIKTIIAPLLFSTLVVGIAGHSDLKQVGRMGWKSILYFEVVTTIALFIGLVAINVSKAGVGSSLQAQTEQVDKANKLLEQKHTHNVILDIFPENIAKSVADNQILQIVIFSILFGIALAQVKGERKEKMVSAIEGLAEVMFKFTNLVMYVAPLAVGGAIGYAVASMGYGVLHDLLKLLVTLYVALIVFVLVVLVPIGLMVKLPFKKFIEHISEPLSIAFATASSEAALPKAMENLEKMGIPRKVVAFVLPTGYSFNLDGTTLYLSLASVFVAQVCGIDLTIAQQIQMCVILMLTSKGVAGVRGASFLILVGTVASLGLDPQKAFAILAIDALMDMGRTSVNLIGNCLATYVIAKWEGEI